jgi:adenylylsulfate kinase-like enzyme
MKGAPVIVVSGLPGVGKSTTAGALARRFERAAHIEADRLQELIVSGAALPDLEGIGAEARRQLDLRLRNACLLARSFADAGFAAIVDDIVIGDAVDVLRDLLGDGDFHFVMLVPDFAQVKQRWIDMGSPFAHAWDWIDHAIRNDTTRIGLWLDNTDLGVDQTVDAIVAHLQRHAVA